MTDTPSNARSTAQNGGDGKARSVLSVRQAVRDDANQARQWADDRFHSAELAIRQEPVRASLYALGIGLLLGLLISR